MKQTLNINGQNTEKKERDEVNFSIQMKSPIHDESKE
jgi:hypothetical protein